MKKAFQSWILKEPSKEKYCEMGREKRFWDCYYKPGQDVYWFQVPKEGGMKFAYDNIVQKNWGRHWVSPCVPPKRLKENEEFVEEPVVLENVKSGSIIIFGTPRKIADVFLITGIQDGKIQLSPVFFSMLWNNLSIIPPIPAYYHHEHRNHPVKLKNGQQVDKYFQEHRDQLFREVYPWTR